MAVILIGESRYKEFELLAESIKKKNQDPIVWDMTDWPSEIPLTFDVGDGTFTVSNSIKVENISGVFSWSHHIFHPSLSRFSDQFEEEGTRNTFLKTDQWRGVFSSFLALFEDHGATVFHPPNSHYYHECKPLQLEQFAKEGIPVPDTLFTNDPDRAREFILKHEEVVYKPIVGAARPERLSASDLDKVPLERLSNAPVQFLEYVPGEDVRVFFLNDKVIGASRYVTDNWTYKTNSKIEKAKSVELREVVRQDIERAASVSPIQFGAADLRVTKDTHTLLEINPDPRFAFHDLCGTTNITNILADALVS